MPEKPNKKPQPAKAAPQKKRKEKEAAGRIRRAGRIGAWFSLDRLKWFVLVFLSLVIAISIYPAVITKTETYKLGDVAEKDIKASHDFLIEKMELTESAREQAAKEVLSVYDFDNSVSNLLLRLREAFSAARGYYSSTLPKGGSPEPGDGAVGDRKSPGTPDDEKLLMERFFDLLETAPNEEIFEQLARTGFRSEVEEAVIHHLNRIFKKGVVGNRDMLMAQAEKGGITLHELYTQKEIKVADLSRFHDVEGAKRLIAKQKKAIEGKTGSSDLADAAIELARYLIKPNLTFNQRETEQRKDLARNSVKPIYFRIKKGEMLLREGERVGPEHLQKLEGETRSQNQMDLLARVPAMIVFIAILFSVMWVIGLNEVKAFKGGPRELLFNSVTLLGLFIFIWAYHYVAEEMARGIDYVSYRSLLYAMPVPCGAMIISIFQGLPLAMTFSLIISVFASLISGGQVEFFAYFFINSLVAAYGVRRCTERGVLIKAGLKVGLINVVMGFALEMIFGTLYTSEGIAACISGFVGGILTGVIVTGILPLIEMSFGFTTDIKLLELANLDRPLLRELMVQAPGTYHHSVIISNMVEATAKAIHANPLLARVSAYYHDIGKIKKPLYFVENQISGVNKHEKLAPSMSSLILISHAKDGVELAREHKLGREIIDIIQQHHGTNLIQYFYQKAKEREESKGEKSTRVKEQDFRYPGPRPQTKEAGLVMLADMVEAASRSLREPTPARIQGMVQKIINRVFSDGQLDECELTLKDLHEIARNFNKILSGIFHQRIEYPDQAVRNGKKAKDGSPDHVPEEDPGARKPEDKKTTEEGLKRLGLS